MRLARTTVGCLALAFAMGGCMDTDLDDPATDDDDAITTYSNGVTTTTTSCNGSAWQSPATGTAHARISTCKIVWGKDTSISPPDYFQTVSFDLDDPFTDGVCAIGSVGSTTRTWCQGSFQPFSISLTGHRSSIAVTLSWGGHNPVSHTQNAPSGF